MRLFISKIKKLIASERGVSTYLFMFSLAPLVVVVLLIAIDLNIYLLTRANLQNALDTAATYALTKSTNDTYRSDKILKIVTNNDDSDIKEKNYASRLQYGILYNFKPIDNDISVTTENYNATLKSPTIYKMSFTPDISFIEDEMTVEMKYVDNAAGGGDEFSTGDPLSAAQGTNKDIELTLTGEIILPTLGKFMDIMGGSDMFKAGVTVESGVRGIRVLKPDEQRGNQW